MKSLFSIKWIRMLWVPGIILALVSILLKVLEYRLVILDHELQLYGLMVAMIFTVTGVIVGRKLSEKGDPHLKEKFIEEGTIKTLMIHYPEKSCLSKREFQILELMAEGKSNKEISEELFVSVHTVKSHASNLYEKLDVKSRTQAIAKAKTDKILS